MPLDRWCLACCLVALSAMPGSADDRTTMRAVPTPMPASRPAIGRWITIVIPSPPVRAPLTTAALPPAVRPGVPPHADTATTGLASFYWQDQMTASGERFDRTALTAAHRSLPFGTMVRITHAASGRSVTVRINDRGPFKPGRIIDMSEAAAKAIGMTGAGLAAVRLDVVR